MRDNIAVQELRIDGQRVVTVLGVDDPIKTPWHRPTARVCGATWEAFFEATDTHARDLWPADVPRDQQTLWTAELFPLMDVPRVKPTGAGVAAGDLTDDDDDDGGGEWEWTPNPHTGRGGRFSATPPPCVSVSVSVSVSVCVCFCFSTCCVHV